MAGLPSEAALQRIAVTVPPTGWLHGILRAYHDLYRQAPNDLGVATIDMPRQTTGKQAPLPTSSARGSRRSPMG